MPKLITAKTNANTDDIVYHLAMAAPGAIAQAKKSNLPEIIGLSGGNLKRDAELTGKWIRGNVKYKADGYENQNIQFPSALLKNKTGDCKSLSLLYLSIMSAAGYPGGFRFASYRPNKKFTHVYNYFTDHAGNKYTYDACIPTLKESNKHTNLKDMKVNYLAGAPVMLEDNDSITRAVSRAKYKGINGYVYHDTGEFISEPEFIGKGKLRKFLNNAWQNVKKAGGNAANTIWKGAKTINFAGPRAAFLGLVVLNARGFASRLKRMLDKDSNKVKELWERFGGDYTKLFDAIKKGATKKPLFGSKKNKSGVKGPEPEFIGFDPVSVGTAIAAATPIIMAMLKMMDKSGVKPQGEEIPPPGDEEIPPPPPGDETAGGNFVPGDPDGEEATAYTKSGGQVFVDTKGRVIERPRTATGEFISTGNLLSGKNVLILGGVAVAAILLLKKKK